MRKPADMTKLQEARDKSKRRPKVPMVTEIGLEWFSYHGGQLTAYEDGQHFRRLTSAERTPDVMEVET